MYFPHFFFVCSIKAEVVQARPGGHKVPRAQRSEIPGDMDVEVTAGGAFSEFGSSSESSYIYNLVLFSCCQVENERHKQATDDTLAIIFVFTCL